jgi:hypothetical protein
VLIVWSLAEAIGGRRKRALLDRHPAVVVDRTRGLQRDRSLSEPQLGLAAAFGLYAIVLLWITLTKPFGGRPFVVATDVLGFLPPYAAAALALHAARKSGANVRTGWALLAAACLAWAIGDTVWTYYEVVLERNPFPSSADIGYLTMLPLIAAGLIVLTSQRRRWANARPALDGVALVLSVVALVWMLVLHPIYAESRATAAEKLVSAAYPVGDLIVIYALVVVMQTRRGQRESAVLTTLLCGMLLFVAADLYFAYLQVNETYSATSIVNVGWPYGFLVIGYAAALESSWPLGTEEREQSSLPPRDWLVPAALFCLQVALMAGAIREGATAVNTPVYVMIIVGAVAVGSRLAINFGLAREIDKHREKVVTWIIDHKDAA